MKHPSEDALVEAVDCEVASESAIALLQITAIRI